MGQFGMDEENEAEKKVETVEELKKRRKAFAYWTVGGEDYKLKLTTQQICKLEEKFRCNLVTLIMQSGGLPQLGIMLTVIQAAMTPWKHGVKYKDVQALYDQYADEGGTQMDLMVDVIMEIMLVSGFYGEPEGECDGQEGGPQGRDVTISDLVYELYPLALDCGIRPDEFWGYSLGEIRDVMGSYARMEQRRVKEQITSRFQLSDLIGLHMQKLFDNKNEINLPNVWDIYPDLFAEEQEAYEERQRAEALEQAKISRREYAARFNEMRRQRGLI